MHTYSGTASFHLSLAAVACCSLTLLAPLAGLGQPQFQTIPSTADVRAHFRAAIDLAASKWEVAIIAESSPVMETLGGDPTDGAKETVDQAIQRIAGQFDYSATRHGRIFILTKKFTDPDDCPDLTLPE